MPIGGRGAMVSGQSQPSGTLAMSVLQCLALFVVMTPLGVFMCRVTWPMARERVGVAHRALGLLVCVAGAILAGGGLAFLAMAVDMLAA